MVAAHSNPSARADRGARRRLCGPSGVDRPRERRGFTLVEMLVAIGIMALLASLTMTVTRRFVEQSEVRTTRITLRLLDAALREWEMTADRKLTWWDPRDDAEKRDLADVRGDVPDVFIITDVLEIIRRTRVSRDILAQVDPAFLHTYRAGQVPDWISYEDQYLYGEYLGQLTVLDAWDTPIYATHPGRPWRSEDLAEFGDPDEDRTITTDNERRYGIAPGRQVVFVSAGPDGLFGVPAEFEHVYGEERTEALTDARADNLYSARVMYPTNGE